MYNIESVVVKNKHFFGLDENIFFCKKGLHQNTIFCCCVYCVDVDVM